MRSAVRRSVLFAFVAWVVAAGCSLNPQPEVPSDNGNSGAGGSYSAGGSQASGGALGMDGSSGNGGASNGGSGGGWLYDAGADAPIPNGDASDADADGETQDGGDADSGEVEEADDAWTD